MSQRQAVTQTTVRRYQAASKQDKGRVLDELCATTGWHRNHARKALKQALTPRLVRPRPVRRLVYGEAVIEALRFCWAVMGAASGKRMAPFLAELVGRLRACGELRIDDATAGLLCRMSAATIDRRLVADRAKLSPHGKSHTKPGSLLRSQIPIRTWAEWDEDQPGFVEIDLVGHEGGNIGGKFCFTLTVTDIATGWTENRTVADKLQESVFAALLDITKVFPFPILGIDSDNGAEFINNLLLDYCTKHKITFTRSRPGIKNDGSHVEQKNWAVVRQIVGYFRYDTPAELDLLNQIWVAQSNLTNFFYPQQKLVFKQRAGAKITKRYDTAVTPNQRAQTHQNVTADDKARLADRYQPLNPAAAQRHVQALSAQLLALAMAKRAPRNHPRTRALPDEATNPATRAS